MPHSADDFFGLNYLQGGGQGMMTGNVKPQKDPQTATRDAKRSKAQQQPIGPEAANAQQWNPMNRQRSNMGRRNG